MARAMAPDSSNLLVGLDPSLTAIDHPGAVVRQFVPKALFASALIGALVVANTMPALELTDGTSLDLSDVAAKLNLQGKGWVTSLSWLAGTASLLIFLLFPIAERFIRTLGASAFAIVTMVLPYYVNAHQTRIDENADSLGSGLLSTWILLGVAAVIPWCSLLWWNRQTPLFGRLWTKWMFLLPAVIWILSLTIFPLVYAFT